MLSGIYTFLLLYLTQGLLERNAAHIDRAIAILEPLREAFDGTRER
jgi:flagellin-specific chaperone FliS